MLLIHLGQSESVTRVARLGTTRRRIFRYPSFTLLHGALAGTARHSEDHVLLLSLRVQPLASFHLRKSSMLMLT